MVRTDAIGALTAWALIVPECEAYAQIAGVPVQNAFYAAPVALIAYALSGTSRLLVVGRDLFRRLIRGYGWIVRRRSRVTNPRVPR
ncbi:SulP family inorganic anion transporter [Streptomyces sp. H39-S7]|uniref:SulP family inorganic anion transporter n=1 Tax=Streptomyces sp. H39-S7 TaxID=3004357 RepID=UPI0022AEF68A|nr:SulP family inorganic anion transporter [Streptomyces sp. H39-S7]MCZ4125551.1 SulP family inorganic anion transporter [Streptomyces sp. H39-S7]